MTAGVVFNIGGVSVIVTVPHAPSSSKLLGRLVPCRDGELHQPNWDSGRALLRRAAGATRAPSAAIAAFNEFLLFH